MEEGERGLEEGILALFMEMALVMLLLQDKMGQLMVKERCGGNFGGTEHWSIQEGTSLN